MNPRVQTLISELRLQAHPEGGYYAEVHRSASRVRPSDARGERTALTTIYFLLAAGDVSRWHAVASDEAWHFYEGAPLELFTAGGRFEQVERNVLGDVSDGLRPVHVVPAQRWQAARSTGAYTLVGCTVGPGFEFEDFRMLADEPELAQAARTTPDAAAYI